MGLVTSLFLGASVAAGSTVLGLHLGGGFWQEKWDDAVQRVTTIPILQVTTDDMPSWIKVRPAQIVSGKFGAYDPISAIDENLSDTAFRAALISKKFLSANPGEMVTIPHGVSNLRDLVLLLNFYAGFGPMNTYLNIQHYEWLHEHWERLRRDFESFDTSIPIPKIETPTYAVDETTISYIVYGEIKQLTAHLWFHVFQLNPQYKLMNPWFSDKIVPEFKSFGCCTGMTMEKGSKIQFSDKQLREFVSAHGTSKGLYPPQGYTSSGAVIMLDHNKHVGVGFAPNIWAPLALGLFGLDHGQLPDLSDVNIPTLIPNSATARWPNHFTSWVNMLDHQTKGTISALPNAPVNTSLLINGPIKSYPIEDRDQKGWNIKLDWQKTCENGHVIVTEPCPSCLFEKDNDGVCDVNLARLNWVPYSSVRIICSLLSPAPIDYQREAAQWLMFLQRGSSKFVLKTSTSASKMSFWDVFVGSPDVLSWDQEKHWVHKPFTPWTFDS